METRESPSHVNRLWNHPVQMCIVKSLVEKMCFFFDTLNPDDKFQYGLKSHF